MNTELELASRCVADSSDGSEPCLRYWNGEWYRWNGCTYAELSTDEMKSQIFRYLVRTGAKSVSRNAINSIMDTMKYLTLVEAATVPCWLSQEPMYPAEEIVAAQNGLLHLPGLVRGRSAVLPFRRQLLFPLNDN